MLFQQVTDILFCYHEDVSGAVLQPGMSSLGAQPHGAGVL